MIAKGEILLVEEKGRLMERMGRKTLRIELAETLEAVPDSLADHGLEQEGPTTLVYSYDTRGERTGITRLLNDIAAAGLHLADLSTKQSSLEEIFVSLVQEDAA